MDNRPGELFIWRFLLYGVLAWLLLVVLVFAVLKQSEQSFLCLLIFAAAGIAWPIARWYDIEAGSDRPRSGTDVVTYGNLANRSIGRLLLGFVVSLIGWALLINILIQGKGSVPWEFLVFPAIAAAVAIAAAWWFVDVQRYIAEKERYWPDYFAESRRRRGLAPISTFAGLDIQRELDRLAAEVGIAEDVKVRAIRQLSLVYRQVAHQTVQTAKSTHPDKEALIAQLRADFLRYAEEIMDKPYKY